MALVFNKGLSPVLRCNIGRVLVPSVSCSTATVTSKEHKANFVPFSKIPGPSGTSFLEKLAVGDGLKQFSSLRKEYGLPVVKYFGIFMQEEVALFDIDDIRFIYANEGKYPYSIVQDMWANTKYSEMKSAEIGTDILVGITTGGEKWKKAREKIGTGLMVKEAAKYLPLIDVAARAAVQHIEHYKDNIPEWTKLAAFDMFTSAALGINPEASNPKSSHELKQMIELGDAAVILSTDLSFKPLMTPEEKEKKFNQMVEFNDQSSKIASTYIARMEADKVGPECWFKHLIQERNMSQQEVSVLMPAFLNAGIGTTSGVVQWLLVNLAKNPDKQDILHRELKEVLEGKPFAKEIDLPYLKACIRESHRLTPPAPSLTYRTLDKDVVTPSGYEIPAGTKICLNPYPANIDDKVVENAQSFIPERFLADNVQKRKDSGASQHIDHGLNKHPFSMGARACLGRRAAELEILAIFANLISNYRVVATPLNQHCEMVTEGVGVPRPFPKVEVRRRA